MRLSLSFRRLSLILALIVSLGVAITHSLPAHADSTTAPTATDMVLHNNVTNSDYPAPGGVGVPNSQFFTIDGTSYDTNTTYSIRSVVLSIQNSDTLNWLQADGTWGTTYYHFVVRVSSNACTLQILNGTQTQVCPWSWTPPYQPYANGSYVITARTKDNALPAHIEAVPQQYYFSFGDSSSPGPYLTLDFGRTTWLQWRDHLCTQPIGGATGSEYSLQQIADQMKSMNPLYPNLFGVGNVIINRTLTSTTQQECADSISYPNWTQLANLRSNDGWRFVSAGLVYNNLLKYQSNPTQPIPDVAVSQYPAIPAAPDMQSEICGSATALINNGFPEGNGMFAYPDNEVSNATSPDYLQTNFTVNCFRWGRRYGPTGETDGLQMPKGPPSKPQNDNPPATPLWYARTISINGGLCADQQTDVPGMPNGSGITCTGAPTNSGAAYFSVPELENIVETMTPSHWVELQFYRLVTGSNLSGTGERWDCTSSDWAEHWTSSAELYCYNDFQQIVSSIPAGVTIADPQTVATAFGRTSP